MDRPLRIAHVITRMNVGGAAGFVVDACRLLRPDEFECSVVTGPSPAYEGDVSNELGSSARLVPVSALRRAPNPVTDRVAARDLARALKDLRPDLIHTHTAKAGLLGRWAARSLGIPCVHHIHGWSGLGARHALVRAAYVRAERSAARWCERLLAVAVTDIDLGLAHGIGRSEQYRLVRAGIDVDGVERASKEPPVGLLAALEGRPAIGFIGRLCAQKDPLTFVRAAALVAEAWPEARFVLMGDGPLRAATERLIGSHRLGERMVRAPATTSAPGVLGRLTALVHPSRHEGLPRLLLEAFAAGTPVVGTRVNGCAEILEDERSGLVVEPGDAGAIARAVLRLRVDAGLRGRLASEARGRLGPFEIRDGVRDLAAVYREVHRGRAPGR